MIVKILQLLGYHDGYLIGHRINTLALIELLYDVSNWIVNTVILIIENFTLTLAVKN